ncbi:MAG: FAD-dependent oxidoreductase, partial [Planctomycetota bacterium]|jgi:thioredoxin reductase (NADPH)|nr:FAD-dependent oxidoreductase [Planctomycetota bacterium]
VAYCATCDGEFFTGRDIFVVGGGFAAAEEAVFLTKYARHVTILMRGADFSCAASVANAARTHEKITVLGNTVVEEVAGDAALRSLRYRNKATGETTEYRPPEGDTFGVFVFAGYAPATALVRGLAELDEAGYVVVDRTQRTNVEGLYAAGDVCAKNLRQMVTATADGAVAATELEKYVAGLQARTGLCPVQPMTRLPRREPEGATPASPPAGGMLTGEMRSQLADMFGTMDASLVLKLSLDDRPVSAELRGLMDELAGLTDKLTVEPSSPDAPDPHPPCVRICRAGGADTGIAFHGVPGGHEFTSFALALFNAAGPGQSLDPDLRDAIRAIDRPIFFRLLVSLSCTMCPDTVQAAQRMAAENPHIAAEAYDVNHFPELRDRYNVMSVPCIVVNGERVSFGRKNLRQMLELVS